MQKLQMLKQKKDVMKTNTNTCALLKYQVVHIGGVFYTFLLISFHYVDQENRALGCVKQKKAHRT